MTPPSTDWQAFVESVPWIVGAGAAPDVGEPRPATGRGVDRSRFGSFHRLMAAAMTTPLYDRRRGVRAPLVAATKLGGARQLALPPAPVVEADVVHPDHRELLRAFCGNVERAANEPPSWLLNGIDALTYREALHDATVLDDYRWILEDDDATWPIDLGSCYSICREANGNTTFCHGWTATFSCSVRITPLITSRCWAVVRPTRSIACRARRRSWPGWDVSPRNGCSRSISRENRRRLRLHSVTPMRPGASRQSPTRRRARPGPGPEPRRAGPTGRAA